MVSVTGMLTVSIPRRASQKPRLTRPKKSSSLTAAWASVSGAEEMTGCGAGWMVISEPRPETCRPAGRATSSSALPEPVAAVVDRGERGVVEDLLETGDARAHGQHVVVEGAGVEQRTGPGRVVRRHQVGAAAEGAERDAAAEVLAQGGEVRGHAHQRLETAGSEPRGHHLVEDEQRARRRGLGRAASRGTPGSAGTQPPAPSIGSTSTAARSGPCSRISDRVPSTSS